MRSTLLLTNDEMNESISNVTSKPSDDNINDSCNVNNIDHVNNNNSELLDDNETENLNENMNDSQINNVTIEENIFNIDEGSNYVNFKKNAIAKDKNITPIEVSIKNTEKGALHQLLIRSFNNNSFL